MLLYEANYAVFLFVLLLHETDSAAFHESDVAPLLLLILLY